MKHQRLRVPATLLREVEATGRVRVEATESGAVGARRAQEVARAKEDLRHQVSSLAIAGAEKILKREVDAKAHADLLAEIQRQV